MILQVEQLNIEAVKGKRRQPLLHDVTFTISPGETLALIGASGSGKSVTASAVLGLMPSALQVTGGTIRFRGDDLLAWPPRKRRKLCGAEIGAVFQDYQGSFTPFLTIGKQLAEMIRTHRKLGAREARRLALDWLERAGLPAERAYDSWPFQLSGGQLQRAALAAALMLEPALLIADEPTTALDMRTGERVLDLLADLQAQAGSAVLLISHDLHHVRKRADRVVVMKEGELHEGTLDREPALQDL